MRLEHMDLIQIIVCLILFLWIFSLSISVMFQQFTPYMRWTGNTLRSIWRHSWQLIIGVILGYILAGKPFLDFFN